LNPLLASARAEFDGGRYGRAAEILADLLRQNSVEATVREQANRLLADCTFRQGEGNNGKLLEAVDAYKQVLKRCPDPCAGNDVVYFNLARCYEQLKFYYEAAAALEKLLLHYPASPHAVDASFTLGEMNRATGKTELAAARLEDFLARHPDHPQARTAALHLLSLHLAAGRIEGARKSAETVRARWPDLSALPPEALLNLGLVQYWSQQYAEAVRILSLAVSLHPEDAQGTVTLYVLGCALFHAGRPLAALAVFSRVRDRKPDSWEGAESTLAAANIGLIRPDLKVPLFLSLAPAFRDPLEAYDQLLRTSRNPALIERVRFQRAYGFWVKGRYGDAFREFQYITAAYPTGDFAAASRSWMMASVEKILDESFRLGDHAAVAALYFRIPVRELQERLDFRRLYAIGNSLAAVGLDGEARAFWLSLRRRAPDERSRDLLLVSIAKLDLNRRDTAEAARILQGVGRPGDASLQRDVAAVRAGLDRLAGRREEARKGYEEALNLPPDQTGDPFLHRELAVILDAEGLIARAIGEYRKALQGFRTDPERRAAVLADGRTRLAECHLKNGEVREGLQLLEDVSNTAPGASQRRWSSYRIGRTLEKQGNPAAADKAFSRMKGAGEDEFWGKVADFAREDAQWSRKFRTVIR
jgi:tetratricopeptide (TPR) repeat protein